MRVIGRIYDELIVGGELVLRMHAETEHRNRAPVAVVCGIYDELIVQRDPRSKHWKAVIRLEYFLVAGIRQLSVADQNSQSAGVEKRLVHAGNAVDDTGNAERVVVTPPL